MQLKLLSICCFLLAAGCGSGPQPKPVYATTGKVTYNGQPLAGAKIVMHPIDRVMLPRELPNGLTDAQGAFTISTYTTSDGAPTGYYRLTVTPAELMLDGPFPLVYLDPMRSGLKAQVNSATTTIPTLELTGPSLK